jgi:DNA mismatch repair protein MutS
MASTPAPAPAGASLPPRGGLAEALAAIDPDSMTPREALEALYGLKGLYDGRPMD